MNSSKIFKSVAATLVIIGFGIGAPAWSGTIIDEWDSVKAPKAPQLKQITVDAKDTALVVMDLQNTSCTMKRRPRCVASLKPIQDLLKRARAAKMTVAHTITSRGSLEKLLPEVKPISGEPYIKAPVDKFHGEELTKFLKDKGVKQVILVGTSAEGAVIGAATGAAMRGFKVIVPVDGMSSGSPFMEKYAALHLTKAPGTRRVLTLTRIDMITIKGMMPSMGDITSGGTMGDKSGSNNPLDAVKGLFGR